MAGEAWTRRRARISQQHRTSSPCTKRPWIAALAGEHDSQPWCHPDATTQLRNRILARMYNNGAISDTDFRAAEAMPLGLAAPPADHKPCVSER